MEINETDEVPNKGYTLSNKKILKTGFKFVNDLETCIEEMIQSDPMRNLIKT